MNFRLSLYLVAFVVTIAVTLIGVTSANEKPARRFDQMRGRLHRPSVANSYAASDSTGKSSVAAAEAASGGSRFSRLPSFDGQRFGMPPQMPKFVSPVAPSRGSAAAATAGNGGTAAVAQSGPAYEPRQRLSREPKTHAEPKFRSPRFQSASSSASVGNDGATSTASVMSGSPKPRFAAKPRFGNRPRFVNAYAAAAAPGAVASAQHNIESEESHQHHSEPETVNRAQARAGVFTDNNNGLRTSTHVRSTDVEESHEDGSENSDNHQKAKSYGKTYDEDESVDYDKDEEEIDHTPTRFRQKKVKETYKGNATKRRRESGTESEARNRYNVAFNRDFGKFKEHVDQREHLEGDGVHQDSASSEAREIEEEDEDVRDSRGFGMPNQPAVPSMVAQASAGDAGTTSNAAAAAARR